MSKSKSKPTITAVLRKTMKESGLSLYQIAKDTGIVSQSLLRFKRGETSLRLDKADRLAAYFGLRLTPDPDAVPPEPTPENLARPTLAKRTKRRKAK